MTADTTFKEFVEEKGLNFSLLDFGSRQYEKLVEAFNAAKFKMEAEEEAREHTRERARLMLDRQSPEEDLRDRRAQRAPHSKSGAPLASSQP